MGSRRPPIAGPAGCAVALALALAAPAPGRADEPERSAAADSAALRVVILGTGTPNADPERSGPAVAVLAGGRAYLVDAGPGVVRRAAAASRLGLPGLAAEQLDIVFVTHLHSDHTLGLADLIFTPWVLERRAPLRVFGPPGVRAMTDHLVAAYREDIDRRQRGFEPDKHEGYRVEATEFRTGGVIHRDSLVTVTAIPVPHANWRHAFGYRFESGGRVVVVSGDTRPSEAIVAACDGCDLLVHEVYSAEKFRTRPPEWQRYHADAHTSTTELAALATRARPKRLVLYHQLYWGATDEGLVREVRAAGYAGEVVSARDLEVYGTVAASGAATDERSGR